MDRSFGKAIENVEKNLDRNTSEADQINLIRMLLSQYELEKDAEKKKEQERQKMEKNKWGRKVLKMIMDFISFIIMAKNKLRSS